MAAALEADPVAIDDVIDTVVHLEKLGNVAALMRMLGPDADRARPHELTTAHG